MKNLLNRKDKKQPKELPKRITNDTVAQHRGEGLGGWSVSINIPSSTPNVDWYG